MRSERVQRTRAGKIAEVDRGAEPIEKRRQFRLGQPCMEQRQLDACARRAMQQCHHLRTVLAAHDGTAKPGSSESGVPAANECVELAIAPRTPLPQ